ncbi:hypothetical protein HNR23_000531 [Nocardiopsis mwathae]|uniref:Uncharacterized protein n=1 Tax=Nocardiopsis mwathae TaxID=1472723 RepID=A0A7W9YFT1_9ACTN|nr:hypothetical protein [Nocardiopsis mwathae]MBB6170471.1 hypothetical protein [Nocardiopsis mwathae]
MEATTDNGPLRGVDDIDWRALAPTRGEEIPELLRKIADGDDTATGPGESLSALYDIVRYPGPGYPAAPTVARFLIDIACAPSTPARLRWRPLSLLLEFLAPNAAVLVPQRPDVGLWRDEVAWANSTDLDKVREQYAEWLRDAPDEQQYRRIRHRFEAIGRDNGPALLEAELAVHDTVCERVDDLLGLLDGAENRRSLEAPAEWASYVLAFVPEAAEGVRSRLERALSPLERPAPPTPTGLAGMSRPEIQSALSGTARPEIKSAELFALGLLAPADDPAVTVTLTHAMASGHLYNSFAAAVAMATVHGEKAPAEALARIVDGGTKPMGFHGLFGDSWPHPGRIEPEVLAFLALGRGGAATVAARLEMLPEVLAHSEGESRAAALGAALEMAFGPRAQAGEDGPGDDSADLGEDPLRVLWAIAELPAAAWEDDELGGTLDAWGLPSERAEFLEFAGVEADDTGDGQAAHEGDDRPERQQDPAPSRPADTSGGFLSRLFGGGGTAR